MKRRHIGSPRSQLIIKIVVGDLPSPPKITGSMIYHDAALRGMPA